MNSCKAKISCILSYSKREETEHNYSKNKKQNKNSTALPRSVLDVWDTLTILQLSKASIVSSASPVRPLQHTHSWYPGLRMSPFSHPLLSLVLLPQYWQLRNSGSPAAMVLCFDQLSLKDSLHSLCPCHVVPSLNFSPMTLLQQLRLNFHSGEASLQGLQSCYIVPSLSTP